MAQWSIKDFLNHEKGEFMKKGTLFALIGLFIMFALAAIAQTVSPSPAFAAPSSSIADWITSHLSTIVTYGSVLLSEVVMRLFPTSKPLSWLYAVSAVLKWLSQLSTVLASALDGILGQNTSS